MGGWKSSPLCPVSPEIPAPLLQTVPGIFSSARVNSCVFVSHSEAGMEEVQDCSLGGAVPDGICIAKAKTSTIASSVNLKAKSPD